MVKKNFVKPYDLPQLANYAQMGISTLHHPFLKMTSMSPLQYQKRWHLYEARRLLVAAGKDAATVGYQVGYENHSQFNREYKRLFGQPPFRDIQSLMR